MYQLFYEDPNLKKKNTKITNILPDPQNSSLIRTFLNLGSNLIFRLAILVTLRLKQKYRNFDNNFDQLIVWSPTFQALDIYLIRLRGGVQLNEIHSEGGGQFEKNW